MLSKRFIIIRKRLIFSYLIGLSVDIEKPHIGTRIKIVWVFEKLLLGGSLWQMYHPDSEQNQKLKKEFLTYN